MSFQSALPLRGATNSYNAIANAVNISIRAPLAGSDWETVARRMHYENFNPRSPCGERRFIAARPLALRFYFNPRSPCGERLALGDCSLHLAQFQSALPLRGATLCRDRSQCRAAHFNPRSPCGERRRSRRCRPSPGNFNPRSPCGERLEFSDCEDAAELFQSALPLRGATVYGQRLQVRAHISIRAPLAGSDRYIL